jgi:6,7-dimethyl-8-ribityllumazine synthase
MVKSFHRLFVPATQADYDALAEFFTSLGMAPGEHWEGRRSRGIKLDAPESGVEIGMGEGFPKADLVIEVDNADIVADVARRKGYKFTAEVADADWGARMFTLELPAGYGEMCVFAYTENWRNKTTAGELDATGKRFALVVSRFNAFITERLLSGAFDALHRAGAKNEDLEIVRVPGAFEIPSASRMLAETGKYDGIVCLGCLLRGDTAHYEVIVNEVTRGIGQASQETSVPMGFGVLTCDTLEQAVDRAGLKAGNKGFEAALAALEMASLKKAITNAQAE